MKNLEQFPCIKPDLASGGIKREDDSSIIQKPASMWRNPEDWIVLLKYDGVRCIAGIKDYSSYVAGTSAAPHWKLVSRSDKLNESANLDWLRNELFGFSFAEPQLGEVVLDGEIWCPEYELGEINGYWSKQDLRAGWEKLQYRVFDCYWPTHPDMNYTNRMKLLRKLLGTAGWSDTTSQIQFALSPPPRPGGSAVRPWDSQANLSSSVSRSPFVDVAQELEYRLDVAIAMDMEGIIIRKWDIPYQCERGGSNFYRFKNWPDSEFEIVGYEEGIGGFIGVPIWICKTEGSGGTVVALEPKVTSAINMADDYIISILTPYMTTVVSVGGSETFKVTAQGTMPEKNQKWIDRDKYVGEQVKVKYERLRDNGVPQKPISLGIRPAGS
jgi:ATP-dependent DNA ligase